jgi:RNA-directed DNA polymerase
MYIERWRKAQIQKEDGKAEEITKGTPQGRVISPLLANILFHYAFDKWMEKGFPVVEFERYAYDIIVHSRSLTNTRSLDTELRQQSDG